jgi:hypothetical protein
MSRNQRIALVLAALVVAVVAFAIASPGGDDEDEQAAETAPAETAPADDTAGGSDTQTETETEPEPPPQPPKPEITRIRIRAGAVAGGAREVEASTGDTVRIVVAADAPDEIHLHGYDITKSAAPGKPARFVFKATLEGVFELESHTAEDAGKNPLVARLLVEPS